MDHTNYNCFNLCLLGYDDMMNEAVCNAFFLSDKEIVDITQQQGQAGSK